MGYKSTTTVEYQHGPVLIEEQRSRLIVLGLLSEKWNKAHIE